MESMTTTLPNFTSLEEKIKYLLAQELMELKANNPDSQVCPLCLNMGAVTLNVPVESPAFGKAYTCPCGYNERVVTGRFIEGREDRLSKALPESHRHITFDSWREMPPDQLKGKADALDACAELAHQGQINRKGIIKVGVVLSGLPGVGKTSVAMATVNAMMSHHVGVWWVDYNDFIDNIQATYAKDYRGTSKLKLIADASKVPVLVLDDMGDYTKAAKDKDKPEISNDKRDITYSLIRERYHSAAITIITTNLDRAAFSITFGERIARRVKERYLWLDMTGPDLSTY